MVKYCIWVIHVVYAYAFMPFLDPAMYSFRFRFREPKSMTWEMILLKWCVPNIMEGDGWLNML